MREYRLASPSLDGVLSHESLAYDGIRRPTEVLRVLDGPQKKQQISEQDQEALEQYFYDLYGVFMKKLSFLVVESDIRSIDTVQIQAMLQELIKVKRLLSSELT